MGIYVKTPAGKSSLRKKVTANEIKSALGYTPANPENIVIPDVEVTAESIKNALGYTPADKNAVANIDISDIESKDDTFYIVDKNDKIIAKVDGEGLHVTDVKIGKMDGETLIEKTLTEFVTEIIPNNGGNGSSNVDLTDYYKKSDTYSQDEVDALIEALSEEIVSGKEEFHIVDKEGHIVATIDAAGVQTTCVTTKEIIIAKDDSHTTGVIISDVGKSQGNITTPILDFVCENAGEPVILRGISSPLAEQDATPKSYVDGKLKNVATPTADGHAANKKYVDDEIYKFSSGDNTIKTAQTANALTSGYNVKGGYGAEISVTFNTGKVYVIFVGYYGSYYTGLFLNTGSNRTFMLNNMLGSGENIQCSYSSTLSTISFTIGGESVEIGSCYIREL